MYCQNCGSPNAAESKICSNCGTSMKSPGPEQTAPATSLSIDALAQQVKTLQNEVHQLRVSLNDRVTALERLQGEVKPFPEKVTLTPPPPAVLPEETVTSIPVPAGAIVSPARETTPTPIAQAQVPELSPVKSAAATKPARSREWEQILGGNWLVRIGVLALIVGVAFFLKFAWENDAFGPIVRILLGVAFGLVLLGLAFYWRKKYSIFAQALAGGGIAVIYLSVFASFAVFRVISMYPAVGLLFLISLGSTIIAIRSNSMALAILGIIGAFAAPFFLVFSAAKGAGWPDKGLSTLVYILVVNVGVLVLSAFRNWRWFNLLALFGSLITFSMWDYQYGNEAGLLIREVTITIIFLIFVGTTTLFNIVWRRACRAFDYTLMMINATAYFIISYSLMWSTLRPWIGLFTLLVAILYASLAYLARKRNAGNLHLSYFAAGISVVFLTTSIPVQLGDKAWTIIAWAIEALVFMWFSFVLPKTHFRIYSYVAFFLMAIRLLNFETNLDMRTSSPVFNERVLAFLFSIAIMYLTTYLVWRKGRNYLFRIFLISANFFSLWVIGVEIHDSTLGQASAQAISVPIFFVIFAGITLLPFILWRRSCKSFGLIVIAIDAAFYFGISAVLWGHFRTWMGGLFLLLALFHGGLTYFLIRKRGEGDSALINCLAGISIAFLTVAIPVQFGHEVWTTLAWSVEMIGLVWISFIGRMSFLRSFSYFVFIILSGQLLIFNTSVEVYNFRPVINERFLAYIIGILASYLVVYLMWRKRETLPDWHIPVSTFLVIINFLTLWIFSFEVWGYFYKLQNSLPPYDFFGPAGQALQSARNLSLTALWALYAIALLAIGMVKDIRLLRLWALALLAVPIIKVFAYDVFALEQIYRIIAFVVLGILLIVGGYLYQRYSRTIRGFLVKTK